ncbi:probable serine/threonine-protein kinase At1g09600 isoform X2 [Malania oleifera]|uniref:probable serine/threonine-protein kinase At1g09600 isoform X2 n=1 Tax=Malania oleifera TaxID=397392 RepID=UPI0025AEC351|nr:probable serine/threonine-protein kinase At1g09600 isoform X2 [Malania oleifera]XP_057974971.1 probable serine/threonine-protein kinase At1g09600 isoform X2 [Malania oleifera]XP_057974972.1 probable serine/threonine-protein kinase At1g09600 isoform X2 [Malania oleifera]
MGCICSKGTCATAQPDESGKDRQLNYKPSATPVAPSKKEEIVVEIRTNGYVHHPSSKPAVQANVRVPVPDEEEKALTSAERGIKTHHQRRATVDIGVNVAHAPISRIVSMPHGAEGEQVLAGWPSWLSSVAGEAIKGWVPRRADSFEKLDKIGQGTYSSVYKARDLETGRIVAMKKVRFVNMDPESVRFMAREILILRKLDHPNVMKLEGLVTSRMSCSLYLVFEYMEHDLAGLTATRGIKFTEPQIKCYMQQLFRGLEHCHSRGVLHRDIKGSNLLISNNGVLKIGDFGLATLFQPDQIQPLTSRVVTLWYRAPELLLGATEYGVAIDLWSTGCILAELLSGKPIMPGRTEVEQMHKIFKLCGSPSEEYWRKSKLPHATSFKPQHPYKRCVSETFKDFPPSALALVDKLLTIEPEDRGRAAFALKSEFFTTKPLPCDPSSLPKYPPSKEFDAKLRDEARRQRAGAVKGRGPESVRRGSRDTKGVPTPEFNAQGQVQSNLKGSNAEYSGSGYPIEPPKGTVHSGLSHSASVIHHKADGSSWTKKVRNNENMGPGRTSRNNAELKTQKSHIPQGATDLSNFSHRKNETVSSRESSMDYVPKKNRIHYSGPLMPPGGNIDDMLKEHERQIQQAVRKARLDKTKTKKTYEDYGQSNLVVHVTNGR